jgi:DNA-binding FadR family transcriptional regulator
VTESRPRFGPVVRRMVSVEVRDALAGSIRSGFLTPGARLPSERALCEEFGVARTSVREAVQSLVALGQIHKQGNRFYVVERLPEITVPAADERKIRVRELFEVRKVIEVAIAARAAARADTAQVAQIAAVAASFGPGMTLAEFREQDRLFHWSIAGACGNSALQELYGKVLDAVFASEEFRGLLAAQGNADAVRDVIRESAQAHRSIADAIAARDIEQAAMAAERHLTQVEHSMTDLMF